MAESLKEEIEEVSDRIRISAEQDRRAARLFSLYGIGKWSALGKYRGTEGTSYNAPVKRKSKKKIKPLKTIDSN